MTPDDVPTEITKRAYNIKGVSQNTYAAVYADVRDLIRHEAAEEIRDNIGREDYPNESESVRDIVSVVRSVADLIDPEVEK